jgi:hypothetical protein
MVTVHGCGMQRALGDLRGGGGAAALADTPNTSIEPKHYRQN